MSTTEDTQRIGIGIDFGGTFIKIATVNDAGVILDKRKLATKELGGCNAVLDALSHHAKELAAAATARQPHCVWTGVGVGVPGFVTHERGFVHDLPNVPGWSGVPLASLLEERIKMRVSVDNDVNVMALGECTFGAGRAYQHAVFVTLGTGVGGGLLINNKLYRGAHSMAGELGHMTIDMNGIKSPTGIGGLEQYVGNQRIVDRTIQALREGRPSLLNEWCKGDFSKLDPKTIEDAAMQGDALSIEIYDFVGDCLAAAFASVTYLLQPQAFIIGGGVGKSGPVLYDPLQRHLNERLSPHFAKRIAIKKAELGNEAGVIGGAALTFLE